MAHIVNRAKVLGIPAVASRALSAKSRTSSMLTTRRAQHAHQEKNRMCSKQHVRCVQGQRFLPLASNAQIAVGRTPSRWIQLTTQSKSDAIVARPVKVQAQIA